MVFTKRWTNERRERCKIYEKEIRDVVLDAKRG